MLIIFYVWGFYYHTLLSTLIGLGNIGLGAVRMFLGGQAYAEAGKKALQMMGYPEKDGVFVISFCCIHTYIHFVYHPQSWTDLISIFLIVRKLV